MPSSFGALGVGVAGRDECELHRTPRECRAAERVLASSVRMLRDLRLRCGDTSSYLQKKCSDGFRVLLVPEVRPLRPRLRTGAARPYCILLLAVTLTKELTLCGLGLAHSVRFFHHARSAPGSAQRVSDDRAYVKTNGSSAFELCVYRVIRAGCTRAGKSAQSTKAVVGARGGDVGEGKRLRGLAVRCAQYCVTKSQTGFCCLWRPRVT